jgi:hypothetical protein
MIIPPYLINGQKDPTGYGHTPIEAFYNGTFCITFPLIPHSKKVHSYSVLFEKISRLVSAIYSHDKAKVKKEIPDY